MKKILFIMFMLISVCGLAQDVKQIQNRAAQKVGQMNSYIAQMYAKSNSLENRRFYRDKALNLFIGRGRNYTIGGINKCVQMQVTSTNSSVVATKPIRDYFERIINLRYDRIEVNSTDIIDMEVSALREVEDNLYECTVYYVQEFRGYRDGRMVYGDRTKKNVQVYVKAERDEEGAWEFIVMLGDTKATATERI